ncbi:DNA-binding SARP family transcriptional activator [Streptosporangium becharense]|uniref:DNA-binding SARP family transcriptional activator n=1 Tax=Streptosporangium becharense TaxID=1816182 RepID=A0A7W9MH67_9ACTN|nr:BTAD domain-containing putative transcriptional regulator [Streptosporangium becharense]MBB2908843.1 DNA-binding SARP family transcriptional activator [Streptosporangium becharense]MBB5820139.1 DNA-binding SARP family transcriptional activator [Streptosporangium becharense]
MEFRVLGPLEVRDDAGTPVNLGGPRQRAVLARLLVEGGSVVSADRLIDDVYDGAPPASATATLQSYVSNLRRVIEPDRGPRTRSRLLVGRLPGYALAATEVDALRFGELVDRSESRPAAEALSCLEEALRLWRGSPYGEFCDETWAVAEVRRLWEQRAVAVERRAQALLDLGRPQAVIPDLEGETAANPSRERLWCLLALALYRTGRQAEALAVLRGAGNALAGRLRGNPGSELRTMEDAILRQVDSLGPVTTTAVLDAPTAVRGRQPLRGRETQLAELRNMLTTNSGLAVAAVSGEPGIGKTSLLTAFRDHCAGFGHLVLWGGCDDTRETPPLWPWVQVLQELQRHCPPPDRSALRGLLDDQPQPHSMEPSQFVKPSQSMEPHPVEPSHPMEPSQSVETVSPRRNRAVAQWLVTAAREQPVVVILDDLHRADPASVDLLRDVFILARALPGSPRVTIVTAFRDSISPCATTHPVEDLLSRLARYDLVRIHLGGLGAEAVQALAADLGITVDEPTARRLTGRTGGNPFFLRESLFLLARGRKPGTVIGAAPPASSAAVPTAVPDTASTAVPDTVFTAVPDTVAELIRQRLTALGSRVGEVLEIAALTGPDFDPALVAELDDDSAYDALDRAAQAGLLVSHAGRMTFAHGLVRETIIGAVTPPRKAEIHRAAMIALSSRPDTDVAVIAHHAVEAGPGARHEAIRWARAAAEQASLRLAHDEAVIWWDRAIAAHDACGGDPETRADLASRRVRTLTEAGHLVEARQTRTESGHLIDARQTRTEAGQAVDHAKADREPAAHASAARPLIAPDAPAPDAPGDWTLTAPGVPVGWTLHPLRHDRVSACVPR